MNSIGKLQEFVIKNRGSYGAPQYELTEVSGESHCPIFTMVVLCGNMNCTGKGNSKKIAKQAAAVKMLEELLKKNCVNVSDEHNNNSINSVHEVEDAKAVEQPEKEKDNQSTNSDSVSNTQIETATSLNPSNDQIDLKENTVGALQELCMMKPLTLPEYSLEDKSGPSHQPSFTILCRVGDVLGRGVGSGKKEAKRKAAWAVLEQVRNNGSSDKDIKTEQDSGGQDSYSVVSLVVNDIIESIMSSLI